MATALANEIDPREFDSPGFQKNPFPLYKRLRDHHPLFRDRFHNRWIISRYDDVKHHGTDEIHGELTGLVGDANILRS